MNNILQEISDNELYSRCKHFGEIALKYRWKFAGLLPEVNRRRLYARKGYGSIFEFAAKLAGMSEQQVRRVLNLEKSFDDKPILKTMLVEGRISPNKLARVASVATREDEEFWAGQVKILPNRALETLVKDQKHLLKKPTASSLAFVMPNALEMALLAQESVHVHTRLSENLPSSDMSTSDEEITATDLGLSASTVKKLLELKRCSINIDDLFAIFLEKRELEIAQEKEALSAETRPTNSRYIPTKIRELIKKEYGDKCSISQCEKPAQDIHHSQRFSIAQIHDPKFLAPLCGDHHKIAHSVDLQFHEFRARAGP